MDLCIISFDLNCIIQLKQFYDITTKVNRRKNATTFGDLPECLATLGIQLILAAYCQFFPRDYFPLRVYYICYSLQLMVAVDLWFSYPSRGTIACSLLPRVDFSPAVLLWTHFFNPWFALKASSWTYFQSRERFRYNNSWIKQMDILYALVIFSSNAFSVQTTSSKHNRNNSW